MSALTIALRGHGMISSLLPSLVSAFVDVKAVESFTAADGTLITALPLPWTKHSSASNTTAPTIQSERIYSENAATTSLYYRNDWAPVSADYVVSCSVVLKSDNNTSASGPAGRMSTGAATFYHGRYDTNTNSWQLFKFVAGTPTQLGSNQPATLVVDQTYSCAIAMLGSTISLIVDGVILVSANDTAIVAPGRAGVRMAGATTSTTGIHLDNWQVIQ